MWLLKNVSTTSLKRDKPLPVRAIVPILFEWCKLILYIPLIGNDQILCAVFLHGLGIELERQKITECAIPSYLFQCWQGYEREGASSATEETTSPASPAGLHPETRPRLLLQTQIWSTSSCEYCYPINTHIS